MKRFMLVLLFGILLPIIVKSSASQIDGLCEGAWQNSNPVLDAEEPDAFETISGSVHSARIKYTGTNASFISWRKHACPAEVIQHSCHFHGNNDRLDELENRHWVTKDPKCPEFWPLEFLLAFRNKRIVFYGDSVMLQLWVYIVCSLHRCYFYLLFFSLKFLTRFVLCIASSGFRIQGFMCTGCNALSMTQKLVPTGNATVASQEAPCASLLKISR